MKIKLNGITWQVNPVTSQNRRRFLHALRLGVLNHVGSCQAVSNGQHGTPQLYEVGDGSLLAGAVSCNSQHIDMAWLLQEVA